MFWRILKKDLKRKKTMNIIMLLFVIMSAMFAAAAINNIAAVTNGIEHYFEKANVPDIAVNTIAGTPYEDEIRALPSVTSIKAEDHIMIFSSKDFKHNGKKQDNFINPAYLVSDKEFGINYFDEDNNIIKSIDKGSFYATSVFIQDENYKVGDEVTITVGDSELTLTYKGRVKGALYSYDASSSPFLLINHEDYDYAAQELPSESELTFRRELYVHTNDVEAVKAVLVGHDDCGFSERENYKFNYTYDMMAAYIMMAISVIIMLAAFVMLRFTVNFTISEEFREIGVMKAVGINNGSIRRLYVIKYLAIAVVGSMIGFLFSIPLSAKMLEAVSENMVLGGKSGNALLGLISCICVVALILLFCYFCTRKVNKLSPIDAVRSGQTGERFGKKSILRLGRSKLPTTGFMALNDVLSAPKQFSIAAIIFALCMLMMTSMSNFSQTLKSEKIYWLFSSEPADAHIGDITIMQDMFTKKNGYIDVIENIEKKLDENGIPGRVSSTIMTSALETTHGDKKADLLFQIWKGSDGYVPPYEEGSAPQKSDEIAMTGKAMKELGAKIGDRVTVKINDEQREFIITGRYTSFAGQSARFCNDFDVSDIRIDGCFGFQVHFDGDNDKEAIEEKIAILRTAIDSDKVYNTEEMIESSTGMSSTLNGIKIMMMVITAVIVALVVVLMERSFISKEKSEIALMKAVGIPDRSIIAQHTIRFVIVSVIACLISTAVLFPLSDFLMNWICNTLIGDVSGIKCDYDPVDIFVICPALLIGITVIGAFFTALYTRTIKASDTASIE